jgi:large subunit ribosomal protein L5
MYEFMDRLFNVAMPRIRDFRGVSPKAFDKFGNYTLGLKEQTIFPEVDQDKSDRARGMNVTFVVKNTDSADESRELLRKLGMPFAN